MSTNSGNKLAEPADWSAHLPVEDTQWQKIRKCLINCRTLSSMILLSIGFVALVYTSIFHPPGTSEKASSIFLGLCIINVVLLLVTLRLQWIDYIRPLLDIEDWVLKMRSGELNSKVPVPHRGQISELAVDLNDFGTMINNLSRDTEQQLLKYTEYTEQKNQSLKILYDVASTINSSLT